MHQSLATKRPRTLQILPHLASGPGRTVAARKRNTARGKNGGDAQCGVPIPLHMCMVWCWNGRSAIPEIDRVVSTVRSANGMNSPVAFVIIDGLKKSAATQMAARRTPGRASIPPGFGRVQMCPQTHRAADREALLPRSGSRPRRLPTPTWEHRTANQRCSYRAGRQACGPRLAPRSIRPVPRGPIPIMASNRSELPIPETNMPSTGSQL